MLVIVYTYHVNSKILHWSVSLYIFKYQLKIVCKEQKSGWYLYIKVQVYAQLRDLYSHGNFRIGKNSR